MAFDLAALMLVLAVVTVGAAVLRWAFVRLGLPGVVGEILLGIALGPSLLGWLWPDAHVRLFPAANDDLLQGLAWLGLVLFVLMVGLEMRWERRGIRTALAAAVGGLALPLLAGIALAAWQPDWFLADETTPVGLVMVGTVLTLSALPVLARILEDLGLLGAPLGVVALGAATIDDVVGWTIMGLLAGGVGSAALGWDILPVLAIALALVVASRALRNRPWHPDAAPSWSLPAILGATFVAAWATHAAGLNAVLGPLAVGAVAASSPGLGKLARERMTGLTRIVLLPLFFVVGGAAVDFRLIAGPAGLLALLAVLAVASLAKTIGGGLGARVAGMGWRDAMACGTLLNARGAVGLVAAKVGLDAHIFSAQGYTLLVMVVALTTLASPILTRAILQPPADGPAGTREAS